jgi:hypothetical protein
VAPGKKASVCALRLPELVVTEQLPRKLVNFSLKELAEEHLINTRRMIL